MTNFISSTEPRNDRSKIFLDPLSAIKYLIQRDLLPESKNCSYCNGTMNMLKSKKYVNEVFYKCKNCNKSNNLFKNKIIYSPKIKIHDYLYSIYKWIENIFEKDVCRNLNFSKSTYQKIKSNIDRYLLAKEEEDFKKLGGKGIKVQVDETAICHGYLQSYPSLMSDDTPGITWLMGLIEEESGNTVYEILPNREASTFKSVFERILEEGSIVITDGHPSYPSAVSHIRGTHKVVSHSTGFKNEEGFHTNNIENLWSLLKYEIKRRRGVLKTNLNVFLREFAFRYKYLRRREENNVKAIFEEITEFLFRNIE